MSKIDNTEKMPKRRGGPMGGGPGGPMGGAMPGDKPKNFGKSIKALLRYLKPYAVLMIIALIFTAAATVLAVIAPGYVRELTNEIGVSQYGFPIDMDAVASIGVILIIFYVTSMLLNYAQAFIMSKTNQNVATNLRTEISKKINKVPLKYYDNNNYGDVLSRVTNDVDTIAQTLNQSISQLVSSVIMLVGVLIAMFVVCWQMAFTAIGSIPLGLILMMVIVKISQKYFIAQQKELGAINGHIEEIYSGANVVKAFNGEKKAQDTFDGINKKLFASSYKSQFLSGLMMPLMSFVSNLGYVAICVVGGVLFVNGTISDIGIITSFFIYLRLFQNPLAQLAQVMNTLQSTAAASERVFDFLGETEEADESKKTTKIEKVKGKVEFRNVQFGYDESRTIINDFSAEIKPGQKVAIVGPTGAGKTTMVNLLMRFYELNGGNILIDDVPINEMKREDVRALFGMVLQDTWLFEGTIRDNIVYSKAGVAEEEIVQACKAANIHHFIKTLPEGYDMVLDNETAISSGQKQLMTIARAMVQNSPMLILDEATSSVDTRTEQLIQDAMDKLTAGRTSFVIAHRLSTIKNADLILVMKDGDIIEKGTHDELIAQNGFYCELYNSQFEQVA